MPGKRINADKGVFVRLTEKQYAKLDSYSKDQEMTLSDVIRELIRGLPDVAIESAPLADGRAKASKAGSKAKRVSSSK